MDVVTRQSRLGSLKLPVLRMGEVAVFGAENICRAVAESAPERRRIVWSSTSHSAGRFLWRPMSV